MCGIFGAFNCDHAAHVVFLGLHGIQHRAKEFAGIVSSDGTNLFRRTGPGIVQDVFRDPGDLERLHGRVAFGHIRYATTEDDPKLDNTQPIMGSFESMEMAIAHNGNLVNHAELRSELAAHGRFKTSLDTEVILRLFCLSSAKDVFARVFDAVRCLRGSYSLIFLWNDMMVAVRDPWGNRPLALGRRGASWFLSSETISFDTLGIAAVREVAPGEILVISKQGISSRYFDEERLSDQPIPHERAQCIFELLYYANPGSKVFGQHVWEFRIRAGRRLCVLCPSLGDAVVGVPDSALFHADGYAAAWEMVPVRGLLRSHYVGRTFVEGVQKLRESAVARKFVPVFALLWGRAVTLIEDSIVRLTTLPEVVRLVRRGGAREVHARVATPPITHPCRYGIDTPDPRELAAANHSVEEIRVLAGVDSLAFMPMEGLKGLVPNPRDYCFACMDGNYRI
ncbi:MAG: amidophosphoribosyltransferase [Candidatus Komeilibacteria bacterium RIFCSPLOWO2_02_FULL_48_11]|uniref:Amidophosphoribosyltransferase n=1 Tax=Candidatus Komeilibacteria bacterium RIFCSPLOWO2_02_FULL_48_11 TaxID=1798553 RepID=A0A1G2BQH4_9BACT|nr:MAG: amidophosphoribosyltransferase [Candidatus Komeilibacteria bacterium RIFCSPLOWO2_02_FULL_48_11]